ncbi:MAG: serine hydrolase, partial [Proteobacteria bacterium]|nr:serine hydrolase [Pseudomonadota bacterium]
TTAAEKSAKERIELLMSKYDSLVAIEDPESVIDDIYAEDADYFIDYIQGKRRIGASREKIKRWITRIKDGLDERKVISQEVKLTVDRAEVRQRISIYADTFGKRINQSITLRLALDKNKWRIREEIARVEIPMAEAKIESAATPPHLANRFRAAADYSRAHGGLSLLIREKGTIIFEEYHNGHTAGKPHQLASGTKSFWGVLAMMAVEEGLFQLDDRVSDTIVEWRDDPRKKTITIRQLLNLTSGLDPAAKLLRGPAVRDKYAAAIAVNAVADPGTLFAYGPSHYFAFGELMKRKLKPRGETVRQYLHRRLLDPIGLKPAFWSDNRSGQIALPFGAFLTAREWSKFGELVRLEGNWQG